MSGRTKKGMIFYVAKEEQYCKYFMHSSIDFKILGLGRRILPFGVVWLCTTITR
jgi:hypothetical protein